MNAATYKSRHSSFLLCLLAHDRVSWAKDDTQVDLMSNSSQDATAGIKRKLFGGLNAKVVAEMLNTAQADRKTLLDRIDAANVELRHVKSELETARFSERNLRTQIETIQTQNQVQIELAIDPLQDRIQQLESELAARPSHDTNEATVEQLRADLANAHQQIEQMRLMQDELESLRFQLQ